MPRDESHAARCRYRGATPASMPVTFAAREALTPPRGGRSAAVHADAPRANGSYATPRRRTRAPATSCARVNTSRRNAIHVVGRVLHRVLRAAALLWAATTAAPAAATSDGPDHFDVAGVPPGATLTLRAGPSEDTAPVAVIGHDARALRNLGCTGGPSFGEWQRMSETQRTQAARRRWCRVRHAGVAGWAPVVSLRESAGEPRTPDAPAPTIMIFISQLMGR